MTHDTSIALFLRGELVAALRANDPDAFRGSLFEGLQELGASEAEELLLDWLHSFLPAEEQDRLLGWHLGVSHNQMRDTDCLINHSFRGGITKLECRWGFGWFGRCQPSNTTLIIIGLFA